MKQTNIITSPAAPVHMIPKEKQSEAPPTLLLPNIRSVNPLVIEGNIGK